ncbi:MAG: hypothetical protein Q8835_02825 [Sweet potato little leaf phytoplasma]|nr:hypothetical protein [Sweet potato little leaf phytoplasma]
MKFKSKNEKLGFFFLSLIESISDRKVSISDRINFLSLKMIDKPVIKYAENILQKANIANPSIED